MFGVGMDANIVSASIRAIMSGLRRAAALQNGGRLSRTSDGICNGGASAVWRPVLPYCEICKCGSKGVSV